MLETLRNVLQITVELELLWKLKENKLLYGNFIVTYILKSVKIIEKISENLCKQMSE